jgi:hypothetical protein
MYTLFDRSEFERCILTEIFDLDISVAQTALLPPSTQRNCHEGVNWLLHFGGGCVLRVAKTPSAGPAQLVPLQQPIGFVSMGQKQTFVEQRWTETDVEKFRKCKRKNYRKDEAGGRNQSCRNYSGRATARISDTPLTKSTHAEVDMARQTLPQRTQGVQFPQSVPEVEVISQTELALLLSLPGRLLRENLRRNVSWEYVVCRLAVGSKSRKEP